MGNVKQLQRLKLFFIYAIMNLLIQFPNAIYGSSANYAAQYGFNELFHYFDYTDNDSDAWKLYE